MNWRDVEMLERRRTKIVATLGPASGDTETIRDLIEAGADVFRLNMSHGDHETHRGVYERVRAAAREAGAAVGVLADLSGPKIRVGRFADGRIELPDGGRVTVTTRDVQGNPELIPSQYSRLHEEVAPGARILLDDGRVALRVQRVEGTEIECEILDGGPLSDRKGMNLPDSQLSAPALSEKDHRDVAFALELGVDFLALSFVRRADDIHQLRTLLPDDHPPRIIAKIERPEALDDIEAIVDASDGIMVARGDLGVELAPEMVPAVQQDLVALARARSRPCIVATQMLESMVADELPTRAEVGDVTTAVLAGADAVMLSAETAAGKHPVRAVAMMDRIARTTEAHQFARRRFRPDGAEPAPGGAPLNEAVARATAQLSRDLRCRAIVVISSGGTGKTARIVSAARPSAPVLAATASDRVLGHMTLLWGVSPMLVHELEDTSAVAHGLARESGLVREGERFLAVEGFRGDDRADEPSITAFSL